MKNQSKIVSFFAIVILIVLVFVGYNSKVKFAKDSNMDSEIPRMAGDDIVDVITSDLPDLESDISKEVDPPKEKDVVTDQTSSNSTSINSSFSQDVNLSIKDQVEFPDGLVVTLVEINDSRCPSGVMCVWAGELAATLEISGGKVGVITKSIQISTVRNNQVILNGYQIDIVKATKSDVIFTVKIL